MISRKMIWWITRTVGASLKTKRHKNLAPKFDWSNWILYFTHLVIISTVFPVNQFRTHLQRRLCFFTKSTNGGTQIERKNAPAQVQVGHTVSAGLYPRHYPLDCFCPIFIIAIRFDRFPVGAIGSVQFRLRFIFFPWYISLLEPI